jgi:hypothetical protein
MSCDRCLGDLKENLAAGKRTACLHKSLDVVYCNENLDEYVLTWEPHHAASKKRKREAVVMTMKRREAAENLQERIGQCDLSLLIHERLLQQLAIQACVSTSADLETLQARMKTVEMHLNSIAVDRDHYTTALAYPTGLERDQRLQVLAAKPNISVLPTHEMATSRSIRLAPYQMGWWYYSGHTKVASIIPTDAISTSRHLNAALLHDGTLIIANGLAYDTTAMKSPNEPNNNSNNLLLQLPTKVLPERLATLVNESTGMSVRSDGQLVLTTSTGVHLVGCQQKCVLAMTGLRTAIMTPEGFVVAHTFSGNVICFDAGETRQQMWTHRLADKSADTMLDYVDLDRQVVVGVKNQVRLVNISTGECESIIARRVYDGISINMAGPYSVCTYTRTGEIFVSDQTGVRVFVRGEQVTKGEFVLRTGRNPFVFMQTTPNGDVLAVMPTGKVMKISLTDKRDLWF